MSGYQPTYVPGDRSPSGGQNPNSPWSTAQTIDLKTNVNRQKTKRWVNAKTYSYAGDDWGDSEDDEEEEEKGVYEEASNKPQPQPSTTTAVSMSTENPQAATGPANQPAIIRPADIYKRLAEEREGEQSGTGSSTQAAHTQEAAQEAGAKAPEPTPLPAGSESKVAPTQLPNAPSESSTAQLPELRRLSGFDGFMGSEDQYGTTSASTEVRSQESTTGPIPTIKEEYVGDDENTRISRESTSARGVTPGLAAVEHPASPEPTGQTAGISADESRHDYTPSDHSKSTALDSPQIADSRHDDSEPHPPSLQEPNTISEANSEANVTALDVSPLSMSKRSSVDPSMVSSTAGEATEQSRPQGEGPQESGLQPQHQTAVLPREYDSSPQSEKVDDNTTTATTTAGDAKQSPYGQPQDLPSPYGLNTPSDTVASPHPTSVTIPDHSSQPSGHKPPQQRLKKKFSWEADSEESDREQPTSPLSPISATLAPGALVINKQPSSSTVNEASHLTTQSPQPPSPEHREVQKETESANSPPSGALNILPHSPLSDNGKDNSSAPVDPLHKNAPDFREITSIPQPKQRIAAFNDARGVYANTDTGLDGWIKNMADSGHPENSDTIQRNGEAPTDSNGPHRPIPSQAKFPKLPSLSNISLPSRHHDGSGSAHGHARQNSGAPLSGMMNTQHVQAKGKDLLHSAGLLGGKAGGAAKGLFAKGRSRFRNSGSADKGEPLPPLPPRPQNIVQAEIESPRPSIGSQHQQQQQHQPSLAVPETIPRVKSLKFDSQPFSVSFMGSMADIMSGSDREEKRPRDSKRYSGRGLTLITEEQVGAQGSSEPQGQGPITNGQILSEVDQPTHTTTIPEILLPTSTEDIETVSAAFSDHDGKGSTAVSIFADEKEIEKGRPSVTVSEIDAKATPEPSVISSADTIDNSKQIEAGGFIGNGVQDQNHPANATQGEELLSRSFSFEQEPETGQLTGSPLPGGNQQAPSTPRTTNGDTTGYKFPPPGAEHSPPGVGVPNPPHGYSTHPAHSRTWSQADQRSVSPLPVIHRHTDTNGSGISLQDSSVAPYPASQQANGKPANYYYSQAGAGCPVPGVYQPPLDEQKKRRTSLGFTGIMSKVNMVRHKAEQAERPSSPGQKRSGMMFKTLKFDLLHGKNKNGRHTPSGAEDPAPAASYTRQYQSVGNRDSMLRDIQRNTPSALSNHSTINGSTHHLNTGVYDGPSPPVDRAPSPHKTLASNRTLSPNGTFSPGRTLSPTPSTNENHWSSNPPSPEDSSAHNAASRSGRFYKSINSILPRLTEPSDTSQTSRQPSPSNETSASPRDAMSGAYSGPSSATIPSGSSFVSNNHFTSTPPLTHSINSPTGSEQNAGHMSRSPAHSPHIKDLHLRSRSPLSRPPDSCDSPTLPSNTHDPAQKLGTFHSSVPHTPRIGDQETPWTITLPQNEQKPHPSGTAQHAVSNSTGIRHTSHNEASVPLPAPPPKVPLNGPYSYLETHPLPGRDSTPTVPPGGASNGTQVPAQTRLVHVASMEPVELPANDDSSEEIVMSSTSYPGQEWQPAYLGHWD